MVEEVESDGLVIIDMGSYRVKLGIPGNDSDDLYFNTIASVVSDGARPEMHLLANPAD